MGFTDCCAPRVFDLGDEAVVLCDRDGRAA